MEYDTCVGHFNAMTLFFNTSSLSMLQCLKIYRYRYQKTKIILSMIPEVRWKILNPILTSFQFFTFFFCRTQLLKTELMLPVADTVRKENLMGKMS